MEPDRATDTRWQEGLREVLGHPIPEEYEMRIRKRLENPGRPNRRESEEAQLPAVPPSDNVVPLGLAALEGATWEDGLRRLALRPVPVDLARVIRRKFSEPVRNVALAAAAVLVMAALGGFFALTSGRGVSDQPSLSAPIVAVGEVGANAGGVSVTPTAETASAPQVLKSAVMAPVQPETTFRLSTVPGSRVSGATIKVAGRLYPAEIRPVRGGALLMFPVRARSNDWAITVAVDGKRWLVRPGR